MKRITCSNRNSGFTLVELLVVIAIISILAGTLFMLINPTELRTKAIHTDLKAKTGQLCEALQACAAVKSVYTECDTYTELGVERPITPVLPSGNPYTVESLATDMFGNPDERIEINGRYDTCRYYCTMRFPTRPADLQVLRSTGCLI